MSLTDYTICELMGLTELPIAEQKACTKKLEETVSSVLLADALNPSLPREELDVLMETLHRDELHHTWSGKIPMNRLPVLRGNVTRRLEWLVAVIIREEIKYLIDICAEDDFAQKLLWKIRATQVMQTGMKWYCPWGICLPRVLFLRKTVFLSFAMKMLWRGIIKSTKKDSNRFFLD